MSLFTKRRKQRRKAEEKGKKTSELAAQRFQEWAKEAMEEQRKRDAMYEES